MFTLLMSFLLLLAILALWAAYPAWGGMVCDWIVCQFKRVTEKKAEEKASETEEKEG